MVDYDHLAGGLAHFDLPNIFRCAVELAEATAAVDPSEWATLSVDIEGPSSPNFERWMERHGPLQRIGEETVRLKRSLGATGPLEFRGGDTEGGPKWESYDQRFNNTIHDRLIRLALVKLATAAIDLSGFATWREWQWHMRGAGLRLLTWGLAQLWEGMSEDERSRVRDRLPRVHKAVGWPANPATDPPAYDGPEGIPLPDQYRVVGNYISCRRDYLDDMQKANNKRVEQGQEMFLRRATLVQFVETAERTAQALQAMAKRDFDTPAEWGELYTKAFWPLACLRRAHEIQPREAWPVAAMRQRKVLANAADILLTCVGGTPEAKAGLKPEDENKALGQFNRATRQLRKAIKGQFIEHLHGESEPAVKPSGRTPKGSTQRGEGRAKLIAALSKHHQYADGGCLNLEPIGNNELAKAAGVYPSTASAFFKDQFEGHAKYRAVCRDAGRLADSLKALNGEFSPHDLYGRRPADEDDRDDEADE